jgi:putative peptide zinc metalloprotease protein
VTFSGLDKAHPIDTAESDPSYLVSAEGGAQLKLSASAFALLRAIESGTSFDELAEEFRKSGRPEILAADLEAVYHRMKTEITAIEEKHRTRPRLPMGFWGRLPLFGAALTSRMASWLQRAYEPAAAAMLLAFMALGLAAVWAQRIPLRLATSTLLPTYGLFFASLVIHELGHASACLRYGAKPSEIGFTFYLVYPAFYSDVSSAWRLRRWQRVIVDVGGAYFQLVVAAVFGLAFLASRWQPFELAALMIVYGVSISLNPVFKFDGYWVLADSLGVTNLGAQPRRLLAHFAARLRNRPTRPLPWSPRLTRFLAAYCGVSLAVWALFTLRLLPTLGYMLRVYPAQVAQLAGDFRHGSSAVEDLFALVASTILLLFVLLMLWRLLSSLARGLRSRLRRRAAAPSDSR